MVYLVGRFCAFIFYHWARGLHIICTKYSFATDTFPYSGLHNILETISFFAAFSSLISLQLTFRLVRPPMWWHRSDIIKASIK